VELVEKKCGAGSSGRAGTVDQQVPSRLRKEKGLNIQVVKKENGVTGLSQRDIVEAKIHGVTGKNLKEAGDASRKELEGTAGVTVTKATVSGGPASASLCEYTLKGLRGLNAVLQLEAGRFVIVQCVCPEAAFAERSKDFPKYLQTLKKLPTAK